MAINKANRSCEYVVFLLDGQRYALQLSTVERVIQVVDITPLPKGPEIVLGIINNQSQIIPVVDIRSRFRLPKKEISLSDQLIIANTSKRQVAILVDSTTGIIESPAEEIVSPERILPHLNFIEGVIKLEDGIVLIHALDTFLSLEEEKSLSVAVKGLGKINEF